MQALYTLILSFTDLPFYGQFLVMLVVTFFGFAFIIWLRNACIAIRDRYDNPVITQVVTAVFWMFAGLFLLSDFGLNCYMASVYGAYPNYHGEGWLLTNRVNWHIDEYNRTGIKTWQFRLSRRICRSFLTSIDKTHCHQIYS